MLLMCSVSAGCQQTVFGILRKDVSVADDLYEKGNPAEASVFYQQAIKKNPGDNQLLLKLARCYYDLKLVEKAVDTYRQVSLESALLSKQDVYQYAEALVGVGDYGLAIEAFKKYSLLAPEDATITKKIWQIQNIENLRENSSHYSVEPLPINSSSGELKPAIIKGGIVFMSNRKHGTEMVEILDANSQSPFYRLFLARSTTDTIAGNVVKKFALPALFDQAFDEGWNTGPISFYQNEQRAVFATNAKKGGPGGVHHFQIMFAERTKNGWRITNSFPYNAEDASCTDPTIDEEGKTLYFASNRRGGFGGFDLYKSELIEGKWTPPVNLGDAVNTSRDEVFPYVFNGASLYFSSDGHPGMGGLDIFKSVISPEGVGEPENMGVPINTGYDDFGMVVDDSGTHGYLSSNRERGGFDDDLYEWDVDLQAYPLTIAGTLKYKSKNWGAGSEMLTLAHARIKLIDKLRDQEVFETTSDNQGKFTIRVPHYSKYLLSITDLEGEESMAILNIPKHREELGSYEVVVVRDFFKQGVKTDRN